MRACAPPPASLVPLPVPGRINNERLPSRTALRGNPRADAGRRARRTGKAVPCPDGRRGHRSGRPHHLVDPAPPCADRARPARSHRRGQRGTQRPAHRRAAAGARRFLAQDRASPGPARRPRRRVFRGDRQARPRDRRRARRSNPRDRPRLYLAQVDALGQGQPKQREPALGPPAVGHRRDLRRRVDCV